MVSRRRETRQSASPWRVPVDTWRHTIELEYRPRSYAIGRALKTATLLLLLAVVGALLVRRAVRA